MKIDAHYYAVLGFCRALGFDKESAGTIAYASQFVDDARINHVVIEGPIPEGVRYDTIDGVPSFFNMATCHSYARIKTFHYEAMIHNTAAFHFVPGCRGKGFGKQMRCKESGPVMSALLNEVMEEDDLVRLGVVLHAYADTFSHQGFSGLLSQVNDIDRLEILGNSGILRDRARQGLRRLREVVSRWGDWVIPAYGHAQALTFPDLPYLRWSYRYDYSDECADTRKSSGVIENRARYRRAFMGMTRYLFIYLMKHPGYREREPDLNGLEVLFRALLPRKREGGRIRHWQNTVIAQGYFEKGDQEALVYDGERWLREAFLNFERRRFLERKVEGVRLREDFASSKWYRYYLAVRWYKERIFHYCAREGLMIPR